MPITANVTNEQITASVGETQIDVSVSGGVGPSGAAGSNGQAATIAVGTVTTGAAGSQASVTNVGTSSAAVFDFTIPAGTTGPQGPQGETGPAGTTTWAGITDKPAFAAVATSGSASDLTAGTLNASRLPASVVRTGVYTDGTVQVDALECNPTPVPESPADTALFRGYDGVDGTSAIYADGRVACAAITLAGTDLASTLSGKAAVSHQHGAITSDGKVGSTAGLVLKTGTAGAVEALAQGTAGQVLKVNSGATGVEWGAAAADVSIDTTAADILSASSGSITADDPGADRLVFWDDSATKLTHLTVGAGLSISGTTIAAANAVVSPSQITGNQNDYSPGTGDIVRLSSDAARNITGISAGTDGEVRVLVNVGSFTITLVHQSTSSTAANRFLVSFGADYLLAANAAAVIMYDGTTSRWRVI